MYVRKGYKPPCSAELATPLNFPHASRSKLKFGLGFGIGYAVDLLYLIWDYIGLPYFITDRTVSYKYVSYLGIV